MRVVKPLIERIADRVALTETGCLEWIGSIHKHGYGAVSTGSRTDGTRRKQWAHRAVYELLVGLIPDGLDLDHLCRNRSCVNPEHLEPVTRRENLMRGETAAAANSRKTHCPAGHAYVDSNVIRNNRGSRNCRTCKNQQRRKG